MLLERVFQCITLGYFVWVHHKTPIHWVFGMGISQNAYTLVFVRVYHKMHIYTLAFCMGISQYAYTLAFCMGISQYTHTLAF